MLISIVGKKVSFTRMEVKLIYLFDYLKTKNNFEVMERVLPQEEDEVDHHHLEEEEDILIVQIHDLLPFLLQEEEFLLIEDIEDLLQDQFLLPQDITIIIITIITEALVHNKIDDEREEEVIIDLEDILEADLQSTSDLDHRIFFFYYYQHK